MQTLGVHRAINSIYGDWTINGVECSLYLEDIKHLLTSSKLKTLSIDTVMWKGYNFGKDQINEKCICCGGVRFIRADISFPPIVVSGLQNRDNKLYRLIDGKHRVMKMLDNGLSENTFYVLDFSEVESHLRPL